MRIGLLQKLDLTFELKIIYIDIGGRREIATVFSQEDISGERSKYACGMRTQQSYRMNVSLCME